MSGLCVNCKREPATKIWVGEGGALAYVHGGGQHLHGGGQHWCERCVITEQLAFSRKLAEKIPDLERKLAALPAPDDGRA